MLIRSLSLALLLILAAPQSQAALSGRLPLTPGGTDFQAYYDDQLGITWAANAHASGSADYATQDAWVSSLVIGGVDGWRLASMDVNGDGEIVNCAAADAATCADNEYGHLFYYQGITVDSPGPFTNLNSGSIYSMTSMLFPGSGFHMGFDFVFGGNWALGDTGSYWAWAVHDGDVAAVVPIPATVWLFFSAMAGLVGLRRRV